MLIISACLAGIPCRYNGESKPYPQIMTLLKEGKAIPLCPEQLGGLSTPREPCEIIGNRVISKTGTDVTDKFIKGAEIILDIAKLCNCKTAILKANSPSCGSNEIYDGTFSGKLIDGDGVTANLLKENGIKVFTEEEILFIPEFQK